MWRHHDFSARGRCTQFFDCRFWKGDPDFILVLHCNYTSIVHGVRLNELFMFAGNGVIAISSLGDASGNLWLRILKGRPGLYIHVQLTLFVYLERFRRYSNFLFGWDYPTGGEILGGFGQNDLQNVKWEKTLAGTSLRQTAALHEIIYMFGLRMCARKKRQEEVTRSVYFTYAWSDP